MRLRHLSTVVLPHPEGPMKAVISCAAISRSTSRTAVWPLYFTSRSRSSKTSSRSRSGSSSGAGVSGTSMPLAGMPTSVVTSMTLAVS